MNEILYLIVALILWVPSMVSVRNLIVSATDADECGIDAAEYALAAFIGTVLAAIWFISLPIYIAVRVGYNVLRFVTRYGHDRDIRRQFKRDADA